MEYSKDIHRNTGPQWSWALLKHAMLEILNVCFACKYFYNLDKDKEEN